MLIHIVNTYVFIVTGSFICDTVCFHIENKLGFNGWLSCPAMMIHVSNTTYAELTARDLGYAFTTRGEMEIKVRVTRITLL